MGFEVSFQGKLEAFRFDDSHRFAIYEGALVIKRGDGPVSIYAPGTWVGIEVDSSEELPPIIFGG